MADPEAEGWANGLCLGSEQVVPIVVGRAKALDGGVELDHGASHVVTGRVRIEAAVNLATLIQQGSKPVRVGAGTAVERHRHPGWRAKQLMASIADSQRTTVGREWAGMEKQPRFFWEPGAKPCQDCPVVPRSSAPTGRFCSLCSRKTALARASA